MLLNVSTINVNDYEELKLGNVEYQRKKHQILNNHLQGWIRSNKKMSFQVNTNNDDK